MRPPSALLAALVLCACGPEQDARLSAAPDVLVVVLDACRADRMGAYGYPRSTTPALDELARDPDTVRFRRHYTQGQGGATKAFTASFFTGLYVFEHGLILGEARQPWTGRPDLPATHVLDERHETLAERFRAAGYHTFFLPRAQRVLAEDGVAQGFDEFHPARVVRGDRARVGKVLELMGRVQRPAFGHVHLAACHLPFRERDRDPGLMRELDFGYDEAARQRQGIDFTTAAIKQAINRGGLTLAPEDVRFLGLVYDAKLRSADQESVRPLLHGLKKVGRYDDLLLVITADHGAELYEHGGYGHDHALWEEIVRVPLLVKFPRGQRPAELPDEVDALTQSSDLGAALLDFVGQPIGPGPPEADLFRGQGRGFAFSETPEAWAFVLEDHKLIHGPGGERLFDLASDPGERRDLAAERPQRVAAMRAAVASLRARRVPGAAPPAEAGPGPGGSR